MPQAAPTVPSPRLERDYYRARARRARAVREALAARNADPFAHVNDDAGYTSLVMPRPSAMLRAEGGAR
jgi:hypothetical protein